MNLLQELHRIVERVRLALHFRRVEEVDDWDGSPTQYSDTDAYCAASLIDVNAAAGRDTKAQSHCMLPVRREGDGETVMLDRALFAAAGGRGITAVERPEDVPEDAWGAAVKSAANKIITGYTQMDRIAPGAVYELAGKEPPEENERMIGVMSAYPRVDDLVWSLHEGWLIDLYFDQDDLFALFERMGVLYIVPVTLDENNDPQLGEPVEVQHDFVPVSRSTSVFRQSDGRYRWLSISATSVLNRAHEIDSRDLFDSMIAFAEGTGDYPYRTFMHQGEAFKSGETDFLCRAENAYITSGLFDETDAGRDAVQAHLRDPDYWGESIGYLPTEDPDLVQIQPGLTVPVYRAGIHVEISDVPKEMACNHFTRTLMIGRSSMSNKLMEALDRFYDGDEDKIAGALDMISGTNEEIERSDLITRDDASESDQADDQVEETTEDAETSDEETVDAETGESEDAGEIVVDEDVVAEIARAVVADETFQTGIADAIRAAVEAQLAPVMERLDQRESEINERIERIEDAPAPATRRVSFRASVDRAPEKTDENGESDQGDTSAQRAQESLDSIPGAYG